MLHLLSWNVRYFSQRAWGITSTTGTLRRVAAAICELDPLPDIIALQEIDERSLRSDAGRLGRRPSDQRGQLAHFTGELNRRCAARGGPSYDALFYRAHGHNRRLSWMSTGLAYLVRRGLDVVEHNTADPHEVTFRRLRPLGRLKQRRICAHLRVIAPESGPVDIFNTHLSLPAFLQRHSHRGPTGGRFGEADNQVAELDRVLSIVRELGEPRRSILVGDFNARAGSRVHRRVESESVLRDAFAEHLARTPHAPNDPNAVPSAGFMGLKFRLDHVFAGADVEVVDFPIGWAWSKDHPMRGLSDHAPLMGVFRIS